MLKSTRRKCQFWLCLLCLVLAVSVCACQSTPPKHRVVTTNGFVPDETTAIAVARAVWTPIYGREQIARHEPYRAILSHGVWNVTGSVREGWVGGAPIAEISKADGRVLRISHER
jgi:hypothetical protein